MCVYLEYCCFLLGDILQYMESVAETTKQQSPLTANTINNPSFVNSQPYQPPPQAYAPPPPPNMAQYFQRPGSPNPSFLQHSYYTQPNPANAPFADQQPSVSVHAPSQALHLGASPDSLAGKFGGNMLALEILRSKLKMIAAYKNWQKRLKEYKDKMTEAARMNPYNRAKVGSLKHTIRKPPGHAHSVKPKAAFFKRPRKYQTKKYPRTFPYNPRYQRRPFSPLKTRSSVYDRLWQQKSAAAARAYRQKLAEYQRRQITNYKRFYVPYARQQLYYPRSNIARPTTAGQPQTAAYQPQPQPQPQPPQPQPIAPQPSVAPQPRPAAPQPQVQADQPQPAVTVVQPQVQSPVVQAQVQSPVVQQQVPSAEQQAQVPEPKPQSQAVADQTQSNLARTQPKDPLEAQVTAVKAMKKKVEESNADQSISDLKHDIENAIQDALNNKADNRESKPADKSKETTAKTVVDTTGSGSGSGLNNVSITGAHFADASGSGSGSDEPSTKNDKVSSES